LFNKTTAFILGAGASVPYGYPTAKGLREFIIKEFRQKYIEYLHIEKHISIDEARNSTDKFSFLISSFKESSIESFDLFLSRNRKEYYNAGKFILAWCILYFETISKFNEDLENPEQDWYRLLFKELTSEMIRSNDLEKFRQNRLNIITFNYDRSLEEYLSRSLFFSFAGDREDVIKSFEWIKIIHTYGKVFELQWEDYKKGEKYSTNDILDLANKAKNNIQIIYDERKTNVDKIKKIITSAERIFILGFGYAIDNIELLGLKNILLKKHKVYGTAFGFNSSEQKKVKDLLLTLNPELPEGQVYLDNIDCVGLLRKYL